MIGDFLKAVGQLGDRRFLRVFGLSLLLTLGLLASMMVGWSWLIALIPENGWTLFGYSLGFLDSVAALLAWTAGALGAVFLMFPVAALFIGLFLEEIADAVEDRHYPHLPPAGRMTFWETLADGLIFFAALIVANLVGLVFYLLAGPLGPFVFLAVNGWLLGRQYFELAAARRIGAKQARRLRREAGARVWLAGALLALGLSIPILNLAIPVLGVAAFTHMYHRVAGDQVLAA
ncbi:MAG: EI24 domain-containing protein [Pseudomonadota bacterium]